MLILPLEDVGGDLRSGVAAAIVLPQVETLELPVRRRGWEGRTIWCLRMKQRQKRTSPLVSLFGLLDEALTEASITCGHFHCVSQETHFII